MSFEQFTREFQTFYQFLFEECQNSTKARKDIVGAEFELFRKDKINSYPNIRTANADEIAQFKQESEGYFNADQYLISQKTGELVAIEENKGHYVDKCFFKRAISNCIEVIATHQEKGKEPPYFILSCPTSYSGAAEILKFQEKVLRPEIFKKLLEKFKYFPLCEHGRTSRKKYLVSAESPFILNERLYREQDEFYRRL